MLDMKGDAIVKTISPRREWNGDDQVHAITIKLAFEGVSVAAVQKGLIGNFGIIYNKNELALSDVNTFDVIRSIENVDVTINGKELKGADIDSIKVTPLSGRKSNVELLVKSRCAPSFTGHVHEKLLESVSVKLKQRQLDLVE